MAVHAYYHDDPEAPVLDGTVGSLVNLLKKCLVDGYGNVGQGTWKAPLGWEGVYDSGFVKAGFRSQDANGTQLWLYVNDNAPDGTDGARTAYVRGYEEFTGFDGGDAPVGLVNPFPTVAQMAGAKWFKSYYADGTAKPWVVMGDEAFFYFASAHYLATYATHHSVQYFGDLLPLRPGDAYHCALACGSAAGTQPPASSMGTYAAYSMATTTQAGVYVARTHAQVLPPVNVAQVWLPGAASVGFTQFFPFPAPLDGGLHMSPLLLFEGAAGLRGQLPGLYGPHHTRPLVHRGTVDGVTGLSGRTLVAVGTGATVTPEDGGAGRVLIDRTGPWR